MTPLTRENLIDGSLRRRLPIPAHLAWSDARIAQSLADTLAQRHKGPTRPGADDAVWVFAYGSLIWNPLFESEAQRNATLAGWRRSFCMRTVVGRGRPERPGRMLSLQPGGHTQGVALRLSAASAEHELRLLWAREMAMGSYRPIWVDLALDGGGSARAIAFVADPAHPHHEADDSVPTVARLIAEACGAFGRNVEYLMALDAALHARGLNDGYVEAVARAVRALEPDAGATAAPADRPDQRPAKGAG